MRLFHEGVRGIAYNSTKHNTHLFAPLVGIFFEKSIDFRIHVVYNRKCRSMRYVI